MPDPVQVYLSKYGKGGQQPPVAPVVAPVDTADPVQAYLAKYGKPDDAAPKFNPGKGAAGGAESVLQGLLGGFADEIGAAGSAAIDTGSDILHRRPTQFRKNYDETLDVARALDKGFEEAHPIGHAAAEIAGSLPWLAVGAGEASEGANLAARVRAAIKSGAKVGAVYGAGNAEGGVKQRLKGATVGAVEGGALGAAAPAVGATLGHIPKVLQETTGIGTKSVALQKMNELLKATGMSVPEFEEKALALKAEGAPVIAGEIPGDLGRRHIEFVTGQPSAKGLDLGTKLSERNEGQFERIRSAVKAATGSDYINVPQTEDELIAAQRAHAQPNYEAAYASGPFESPNLQAARKIPEFQKALEVGQKLAYHDDVLQAMKSGKPIPPPPVAEPAIGALVRPAIRLEDGRIASTPNGTHASIVQRLVADGQLDPKNPLYRDVNSPAYGFVDAKGAFVDRGQATQIAEKKGLKLSQSTGFDTYDIPGVVEASAKRAESNSPANVVWNQGAPAQKGVSIKALDYAKRYLDHVISGGAESGSSFSRTSAQTTSGLLKQILGEVDAANPAYAKARGIYSSDARIREVLDQAKGAVNMNPDELTAWTKTLTPDEMSLARKRFLSEWAGKAGNVNDRSDLTKQFLQNPNVRQRFQAMFPDQNTMETLSALKEREAGMARTHSMANTGSPTAPRLETNESMRSVVGPADIGVGAISPRRAGIRLIGDAGRVIQRHTQKALADELAPLLGAEPGTPEFDALVTALKSQGKGVNALADNHHFLHALARTFAGVQSQNQGP